MVVDTPASVAILFQEPDAERFGRALAGAPIRLIGGHSGGALIRRRRPEAGCRPGGFGGLVEGWDFRGPSVTAQQAQIAINAFRGLGKGRHAGNLNIGDCFSYALAISTSHSLCLKAMHLCLRMSVLPWSDNG